MPNTAKKYIYQVDFLLSGNEKNGAEQVARAFQDLTEQRVRECFLSIKGNEKARKRVSGRIGTPHALDDARELAAILRARDALGVIGSRLPRTISNLGEEQLENIKTLLDSPIGCHRDVFVYSLLLVMNRLGSPWGRQLATPRAAGAKLLAAEIDNVPDEVRHLLRPRLSKEIGADATLDAGEVAKIEAKLVLTAACRSYASELAVSETTRRITLDLQNYFD